LPNVNFLLNITITIHNE